MKIWLISKRVLIVPRIPPHVTMLSLLDCIFNPFFVCYTNRWIFSLNNLIWRHNHSLCRNIEIKYKLRIICIQTQSSGTILAKVDFIPRTLIIHSALLDASMCEMVKIIMSDKNLCVCLSRTFMWKSPVVGKMLKNHFSVFHWCEIMYI